MVLYAIFFVRIISHSSSTGSVNYKVVSTSVGVFLGILLGAAIITRFGIRAISKRWYDKVFMVWIAPWSLIGLFYTILVLFASQGHEVVHQVVSVVRYAAPLIVTVIVIFAFTLWMTHGLEFG
jgi:ACR3 family arsenite transporter